MGSSLVEKSASSTTLTTLALLLNWNTCLVCFIVCVTLIVFYALNGGLDSNCFDSCFYIFVGGQYASGLRLLDNDSGFSLFYQDRNEKWRTVGDVPWK